MAGKKQSPKRKKEIHRDRFAHEYVIDFNGKQAAIRCGYSPKTAESQASRLLRNVKVMEQVKAFAAKKNDDALMSAEEADRRASLLARVNFKDYYDENGDAKPVNQLTDDQAYCLREVTRIETPLGASQKIKITDPHQVLRTIYERRGLLKQNIEGGLKISFVPSFGGEDGDNK